MVFSIKQASAIVISQDVFVANGGDVNDIPGTIGTAMQPLRRESMTTPFQAVVRLDLGGESCTGTWLGDNPDKSSSYFLSAAHCFDYNQGQHSFSAAHDNLLIDPISDNEIWSRTNVAGNKGIVNLLPNVSPGADEDFSITVAPRRADLTAIDGTLVAKPRIYIGTNELNKSVIHLGYGTWGAGSEADGSWQPAIGPRRSMGNNIVTRSGIHLRSTYMPIMGLPDHWVRIHEGDSGSAWWQQQGGVWSIIAGVNGFSATSSDGPRMSNYWDWVRSIYPDVLMYDYRDAASSDTSTEVFRNLLLQAAYAGSLGTGDVTVDPEGELWTVVDNALNGNALINNGVTRIRGEFNETTQTYGDTSSQVVSALSGSNTAALLGLEGNSQLIVNMPSGTNTAYAGLLEGTGSLATQDAGTLTLSGQGSAFTGSASVKSAATLVANGSFPSMPVNVDPGATLAGAGQIGQLTVAGTLAPGTTVGQVGTLSITGGATFLPGSTYLVYTNGPQASSLSAGGPIDIQGGAVTAMSGGIYPENYQYTIASSATGVSGTFDPNVGGDLVFLDPELQYDPHSVFLIFKRNNVNISDILTGDNQRSAAAAVEALPSSSQLRMAILGASREEVLAEFDFLPGDIHASVGTVLAESGHYLRQAAQRRFSISNRQPRLGLERTSSRDAISFASRENHETRSSSAPMSFLSYGAEGKSDKKAALFSSPLPLTYHEALPILAWWSEAYRGWNSFEPTAFRTSAVHENSEGFFGGVDFTIEGLWQIGVAGGYGRRNVANDSQASASLQGFEGSVYGARQFNSARIGGGLTIARHGIDTHRFVKVRTLQENLDTHYSAWVGQLFGEASYAFQNPKWLGTVFEPFANLAVAWTSRGSFTETGGVAALYSNGDKGLFGLSTFGLRASVEEPLVDDLAITLQGALGWDHTFLDRNGHSRLAFVEGSSLFPVKGAELSANSLALEFNVGLKVRIDLRFDLSYSGSYLGQSQSHALNGTVLMKF